MQQLATLTSKRQLTIPAVIFGQLGWSKGQKLFISEDNGAVKLTPVENLVNRLAGSVKVPKRFQGLSVDKMVKKAKGDYFKTKRV